MRNEGTADAVKTVPAVVADLWLWLSNHDAAWFVSALTIAWILSQLYWGWVKYFRKGSKNE